MGVLIKGHTKPLQAFHKLVGRARCRRHGNVAFLLQARLLCRVELLWAGNVLTLGDRQLADAGVGKAHSC